MTKTVGFLDFCLPVDAVGHYLVLAVKVAALENLLKRAVNFLLPNLLRVCVGTNAMDQQQQVDFLLFITFNLLHVEL